MPAPKTKEVTRFVRAADQNVKREFAKALVKALDELMVPPGVPFVVTTPEHLESLDDENSDLKRKIDQQEDDLHMSNVRVVALQEALADYDRGLLDRDELFQRARECRMDEDS